MLKAARRASQRAIASTRHAVQPEVLSQYRIFKPVSHRLHDPVYWSTDAKPMAIGISAGLLWAFWIPVGQILAACFLALWLRGNLPAAAAATFVSNPITIAPLSYLAHQIGTDLLGPAYIQSFTVAVQSELSSFSLSHAVQTMMANLGLPWLVGMAALGLGSAAAGLLLTPLVLGLLRRR